MDRADGECRVFVLDPEPDVLARMPAYRDLATPAERIVTLARAVASSPGLRSLADAAVVARLAEPKRIAVLGRFRPDEVARIEMLPGLVSWAGARLRVLSWADAEAAVERLAGRLRDVLGDEELARCRFRAVPRGGLIVLGMLAYLLDIDAGRLEDGNGPGGGGPLVLVDDIALTGLRFRSALAGAGARDVVFAHLLSHPSLRAAIEAGEPRVTACVAADDLRDVDDPGVEGGSAGWRRRWRERSGPGVYWLGSTEHPCLPWSEPDIALWNPETGTQEAPWRLLPPDRCLKNRPAAGAGIAVQVQGEATGPLRPGAHTVYARLGDGLVAGDWASGLAWEFSGAAAAIWSALVAGEAPDGIAGELAADAGADPAEVKRDVEAFVGRMLELGLLESAGPAVAAR